MPGGPVVRKHHSFRIRAFEHLNEALPVQYDNSLGRPFTLRMPCLTQTRSYERVIKDWIAIQETMEVGQHYDILYKFVYNAWEIRFVPKH